MTVIEQVKEGICYVVLERREAGCKIIVKVIRLITQRTFTNFTVKIKLNSRNNESDHC